MWHSRQWRHWDGALGMQLIDALLDLCSEIIQPIIAIDGPAGAGKTTLAHDIKLALVKSGRHVQSNHNGVASVVEKV